MQLNTTTDYAARVLLYLATVNRMATSQEIAEEMQIPPKYITAIVSKLKKKGYVRTFQGSGGGYMLGCAPDGVTLRDIVETMEGDVKINRGPVCSSSHCALEKSVHSLSRSYDSVQSTIEKALSNVSLRDLVSLPQ